MLFASAFVGFLLGAWVMSLCAAAARRDLMDRIRRLERNDHDDE